MRSSTYLALLALLGCSKAPPPEPSPAEAPPAPAAALRLPDAAPRVAPDAALPAAPEWAAVDRAEEACDDCHPDEVEAWSKAPMARSLQARPALPDLPAEATHPRSGLTWRLDEEGELRGEGIPGAWTPAWAFGSGVHARSYAWQDDTGALYQLPLTWFRGRGWELSPGFAGGPDLGVRRRIPGACVQCHGGAVEPAPGTVGTYPTPPRPMGCSRCHGDAREHAARAGEAGGGKPPTRVDPAGEPDVCAFCHTVGQVRLLRPGRSFSDFVPGSRLADTVAVFVRRDAAGGVGVDSHGERLRLSECSKKSPALTCTTCHQPHPTKPPRSRSAPCVDCHQPNGAKVCSGPAGDDCVACHMRPAASYQVPHVAVTDHLIAKRPQIKPGVPNDSPLVWLAHPDPEPRDPKHMVLLGRAYVEAWRNDAQPKDAERAERLLSAGLAEVRGDAEGWLALATLRRLRGNVAGARVAADEAFELDPENPRVALAAGAMRLQTGNPKRALAALDARIAREDDAEARTLRARVHLQLGQPDAALADVRRAAAMHPTDPEAQLGVGAILRERGDPKGAAEAFAEAARRAPLEVRPWLQLGRVRQEQGDWKGSLEAFTAGEKAAGLEPPALAISQAGQATALLELGRGEQAEARAAAAMRHGVAAPGALTVVGRLALGRGDLEPARKLLDAAIREDPRDGAAWWALSAVRERLGDPTGAADAAARAGALGYPAAGAAGKKP